MSFRANSRQARQRYRSTSTDTSNTTYSRTGLLAVDRGVYGASDLGDRKGFLHDLAT
jgi:hypothetical protein